MFCCIINKKEIVDGHYNSQISRKCSTEHFVFVIRSLRELPHVSRTSQENVQVADLGRWYLGFLW